jgi:hypothetical protein
MRRALTVLRNLFLVTFAIALLSVDAQAKVAFDCEPSPGGSCLCCEHSGGGYCCLVVCGMNWCDCCDGSCSGNSCGES